MNLRCYGRSFSITGVINDLVLEYNTHSILHNEIIYDYSSLFSKTCYVNNPTNVKPRFQRNFECFNQRKNEVIIKTIKNEYVKYLIESMIPLASLLPPQSPYSLWILSHLLLLENDEASTSLARTKCIIKKFKHHPPIFPLILYHVCYQPSILGPRPSHFIVQPPYFYFLGHKGWIIHKK